MPWLTGEASHVYADWSSSPVCRGNINAVPLKSLSTSSNPLVRTSGLDSEGSSENVCSAVFHALQPPTSEEFGRKRHPSTSGEESSHHTLPSHCSTPPSAAEPASARELQSQQGCAGERHRSPVTIHSDSTALTSRGEVPGKRCWHKSRVFLKSALASMCMWVDLLMFNCDNQKNKKEERLCPFFLARWIPHVFSDSTNKAWLTLGSCGTFAVRFPWRALFTRTKFLYYI